MNYNSYTLPPYPGGPGGMIPPGGEVQERQRLSWPPEALHVAP